MCLDTKNLQINPMRKETAQKLRKHHCPKIDKGDCFENTSGYIKYIVVLWKWKFSLVWEALNKCPGHVKFLSLQETMHLLHAPKGQIMHFHDYKSLLSFLFARHESSKDNQHTRSRGIIVVVNTTGLKDERDCSSKNCKTSAHKNLGRNQLIDYHYKQLTDMVFSKIEKKTEHEEFGHGLERKSKSSQYDGKLDCPKSTIDTCDFSKSFHYSSSNAEESEKCLNSCIVNSENYGVFGEGVIWNDEICTDGVAKINKGGKMLDTLGSTTCDIGLNKISKEQWDGRETCVERLEEEYPSNDSHHVNYILYMSKIDAYSGGSDCSEWCSMIESHASALGDGCGPHTASSQLQYILDHELFKTLQLIWEWIYLSSEYYDSFGNQGLSGNHGKHQQNMSVWFNGFRCLIFEQVHRKKQIPKSTQFLKLLRSEACAIIMCVLVTQIKVLWRQHLCNNVDKLIGLDWQVLLSLKTHEILSLILSSIFAFQTSVENSFQLLRIFSLYKMNAVDQTLSKCSHPSYQCQTLYHPKQSAKKITNKQKEDEIDGLKAFDLSRVRQKIKVSCQTPQDIINEEMRHKVVSLEEEKSLHISSYIHSVTDLSLQITGDKHCGKRKDEKLIFKENASGYQCRQKIYISGYKQEATYGSELDIPKKICCQMDNTIDLLEEPQISLEETNQLKLIENKGSTDCEDTLQSQHSFSAEKLHERMPHSVISLSLPPAISASQPHGHFQQVIIGELGLGIEQGSHTQRYTAESCHGSYREQWQGTNCNRDNVCAGLPTKQSVNYTCHDHLNNGCLGIVGNGGDQVLKDVCQEIDTQGTEAGNMPKKSESERENETGTILSENGEKCVQIDCSGETFAAIQCTQKLHDKGYHLLSETTAVSEEDELDGEMKAVSRPTQQYKTEQRFEANNGQWEKILKRQTVANHVRNTIAQTQDKLEQANLMAEITPVKPEKVPRENLPPTSRNQLKDVKRRKRQAYSNERFVNPNERFAGLGLHLMRFEVLRLSSFVRLRDGNQLEENWAVKLAGQGFYNVGGSPIIRCFTCGAEFRIPINWQIFDNSYHKPLCPWLSTNVRVCDGLRGLSNEESSRYLNEFGRGNLTSALSYSLSELSWESSPDGQRDEGMGMAEISMTSGPEADDYGSDPIDGSSRSEDVVDGVVGGAGPDTQERRSSLPENLNSISAGVVQQESENQYTAMIYYTNISDQPSLMMGQQAQGLAPRFDLSRSSYPHFANRQSRLQTFKAWSGEHPMRPEHLSRVGFFYAGYADCVRCFYCGLGLKFWRHDDIPEYQHASHRPQCVFNMMLMGQEYIDRVQQDVARGIPPPSAAASGQQVTQDVPNAQANQNPPSAPAPQGSQHLVGGLVDGFLAEGWTREQINQALNYITTNLGEDHLTVDILQQRLQGQQQEGTGEIRADNSRNASSDSGVYNNSGSSSTPYLSETTNTSSASSSQMEHGQAVSFGINANDGVHSIEDNNWPMNDLNAPGGAVAGASGGADQAVAAPVYSPAQVSKLRRILVERENGKLTQKLRCRVCQNGQVACVYMPCGHVIACRVCADAATVCVLCNKQILATANVYLC